MRKMKWDVFKWFVPLCVVVIVLLMAARGLLVEHAQATQVAQARIQATAKKSAASSKKSSSAAQVASSASTSSKPAAASSSVNKTIDWRAPSETKPYPDIAQHPHLSFDVDLAKQRVYLKDAGKTLYTMYASTGMDDSTPHGHYAIQRERGTHFFNGREMMGANYYTSWLDHGVYLFHSVPTDAKGNYITAEAEKLGKQPGSHGCVRLSIADAKWIFDNAKVGMAVNIS